MAQKEKTGLIKLQIAAGQANPAPPVGPALGQHGVNIMDFCNAFNEKTKELQGMLTPVIITVYKDRSFTFETKSPPASTLIMKELNMKKDDMPMFIKQREIEMRPVEKQNYFKPERMPPFKNTWIKTGGKLPDDQVIQQAFLLYISDMGLLGAANNSVGVNFLTKNLQNASLDHAMWFHRKLDLDGWFLYTIESPITRNARGFSRGSIFSRDGKLIASCTQEGLIRLWDS